MNGAEYIETVKREQGLEGGVIERLEKALPPDDRVWLNTAIKWAFEDGKRDTERTA